MRRSFSLITVSLVLLVAGLLLLPALFAQDTDQTEGSSPQQWEYRVLPIPAASSPLKNVVQAPISRRGDGRWLKGAEVAMAASAGAEAAVAIDQAA